MDYLLRDVGGRICKHLEPLGSNRTSPVWVENNENLPTASTASDGKVRPPSYINFREVFAREWINAALDQLRS